MLMILSRRRAVQRGAARWASTAVLVLTGVLTGACTGVIGDPSDQGAAGGMGSSGSGGPGSTGSGGSGSTGGTLTGTGGSVGMCTREAPASVFHRLNAKQYQETVNQLLGTQLSIRPDLPLDSPLYGFDNNSDTSVTGASMEKYLDAAKTAVTALLANATARAKLVPCSVATNAATCVKTVLTSWLPKAFRRPVTGAEIDKYVSYTSVCSSSGEAGLSCALQAALLSPNFLYRAELVAGPEATTCSEEASLVSTAQNILGQYALASRLSYFLWNTAPDDTLYSLAAGGTLNQPTVLAQQVDRMLGASAAHPVGFVQDFPQQFLPLVPLETVHPSATIFPSFDEPLRTAMRDESLRFFEEVVVNNHSALDLVKADYTFVNDRLAQHYGIPNVTGTQMRQIATAGLNRGGIPTQASFLTATSSTENTSLVLRAKWVLRNLLCMEIPTPDKSLVDSVPPPDPGLGLTNRQSLEIRTANEPCHSCHQFINPIGFGLETFDGIGATRTQDKGKDIDASGELPGGQKFANTAELLALLRTDDRVPACITTKILTYALGRGMVASCDPNDIAALSAQFKADDFKLRNHIVRIVQSSLFGSARARVR
jgi:Protein of unknown function (DUF1592)/Protein of unknown function (DUF1588)/Protein of unknown function (DUF1595)/Protein of unknown function (DUF1587)/Protein of unknown function (DUF1585)